MYMQDLPKSVNFMKIALYEVDTRYTMSLLLITTHCSCFPFFFQIHVILIEAEIPNTQNSKDGKLKL